MNSKIKNILLALPFFSFALTDNEKEVSRKKLLESYKSSKLDLSGSLYLSYSMCLGAVAVGPVLGLQYDSHKKISALLGLQSKVALDLGYISGARIIVAALLGKKSDVVEKSDKFNEEFVKKINDSSNGFFKGAFVFLGADTPYYFSIGAYAKWSESSRLTKSLSFGISIVPNIEVIDSVEVGGILSVGYSVSSEFKKLNAEQQEYVLANMYAELANKNTEEAMKSAGFSEEEIKDYRDDVKKFDSFSGVFKDIEEPKISKEETTKTNEE